MARLSLSLLGRPRIERDGAPVAIDRRKAIAILTFLAVTGERHSREKLAGLFWPDESRSAALAGLRNSLTSLRHAIGEEWIDSTGEKVGLSLREELWLDVRQFSSLLARYGELAHGGDSDGRDGLRLLAEMAQLYRTNFLSQFTIEGATEFGEWKHFQAEELRLKFASVLEHLVAGHARIGETEVALVYARRRLALDPFDEGAHRALARLYAATGRRSLALRQCAECARILKEELKTTPEPQTLKLEADIRARSCVDAGEPGWAGRPIPALGAAAKRAARGRNPGGANAATTMKSRRRRRMLPTTVGAGAVLLTAAALVLLLAVLPALRRSRTVAVLPFEARGLTEDEAALVPVTAERLAAALIADGRITVKAPATAPAAWRDDTAAAGRDLDVGWLVTGTVSAAGDRARVALYLVRARSGIHAWAETYDQGRIELSMLGEAAALSAAEGIASTIVARKSRTR